ncbi:T9SS type A sorting domain-containing protein [Mariniflexile ostreae]|uniref:T9SS type A sorting domain-containing protein n=1 Tax=Mariniflexile ostreae TaxID=1520892 RepID=A0ABV5FAY2_9FLAO
MVQKYFLVLLLLLTFTISFQGFSQDQGNGVPGNSTIEGLSIYPNPVQDGKAFIYITSKNNWVKKVDIYNVLGKHVFSTSISGKELSISGLKSGVYILKVTENNTSESRKLVIM